MSGKHFEARQKLYELYDRGKLRHDEYSYLLSVIAEAGKAADDNYKLERDNERLLKLLRAATGLKDERRREPKRDEYMIGKYTTNHLLPKEIYIDNGSDGISG